MDARTFVIEAVFVVKSDSEEEASELIENLMSNCNDNPAIIDGMVHGGAPSMSIDANFMTPKKRRMLFAND